MAKGIIYWKLKSQYDGDITKGCALTGVEGDQNLNVLEGRDVKTVEVVDDTLIITLYNGEQISVKGLSDSAISNLDFNKETGVLTYEQNGQTYGIQGFATSQNESLELASDATIKGKGTWKNPIGISETAKTGVFKPVKKLLDYQHKEHLPKPQDCKIGDRYVTHEIIGDFGFLYDYDGVRNIICDLKEAGSQWRIPTKEDWDDMLNAVEPCEEDRNHGSSEDNRNLGRWAGKLLKSKNFWTKPHSHKACDDADCPYIDYGEDSALEDGDDACTTTYCGEYNDCDYRHKKDNRDGVDKYGFRVTPAGYADDGKTFLYFKERAIFWTKKYRNNSTVWTKRFDYNRSTVQQEILSEQMHLSLRLVKDYDGTNFYGSEQILDSTYPCVLMPSQTNGNKIWMSANFASNSKKYHALLANDGAGVSSTSHYFINEWNGKEWLRIELQEGEGVVILESATGKDEEYRIVNGQLVSVTNLVKKEVVKKFGGEIALIKDELDNEITRAKEAESELQDQIDSFAETTTKVTELEEALNAEVDARKEADEALTEQITKVSDALTEVKTTLESAIESESKARAEADDAIQAELSNAKGDITSLQGDVKDIFEGATKNDTIAFDPETGLLTSKTFNGATNEVQFSFNFGTF